MGISLAGDDVIEGDVVVAVLSAVEDIKVWCGPVDGLRKRDHFLKSFLWWGVVSCEDGGGGGSHSFSLLRFCSYSLNITTFST